MAKTPSLSNRIIRMKGPLPEEKMFLKCATIKEGLSELTEITMDVFSPDNKIDLGKLVGKQFTVRVQRHNKEWREFHGIAISATALGHTGKYALYQIIVRPRFWVLTKATDSRIFQNMNAPDIIDAVLGDAGLASDVTKKLSGSYASREYCVQYRETYYDFICRLMEQEGMYFYFDHTGSREKLVLCDGAGSHSAIKGGDTVEYHEPEGDSYRRRLDHIFGWTGDERITTGSVTLDDYDFVKPKSDLMVTKNMFKGNHDYKGFAHYDYPGRYHDVSLGDHYAKVRVENLAHEFQTKDGRGNVRTLAVGATYKMIEHERASENAEYLITKASYLIQIDPEDDDSQGHKRTLPGQLEFDEDNKDAFICDFTVIPKATQFRADHNTPWPEIAGVQTAVVTGPSGEEIYTDKYGRIKVQFHWDRDGEKNEKTTCFIRHMTPWSGKNWGMIHVPRIGQEVVVQFEEGDPDRPLVVGMLYNNDTMPPYALPDRMDEMGIVTRSTKSGSADTFHELIFKDEKGKEDIRFQSERDYHQKIKNNAEITIGLEHKDKGDLTQTIHRNKTETLNEGDDKLQIKKGDQTILIDTGSQTQTIKKDQTETIEGKADRTVTGNVTETIKTGNYTQKISAGKGTITAAQSFEIKVGGSSIKLTPGSIEIKSPMIKLNASGMGEFKAGGMLKLEGSGMLQAKGGGMAKVEGGGILMLSGPITKIN